MIGTFDILWVGLVGLAGFLALWPVSLIRRDASIVDFWWGPGVGSMTVALWLSLGQPTNAATLILLVPLLVWSIRLGVHLGVRRIREGAEDPRYADLRRRNSPGWWWKSLFIIFMLQAFLQVFVALGALTAIARSPEVEPSALALILASVAVLAVAVQTISDLQLDRFRAKIPHGGLLTTGLRAYVRYPSYSTEIVFWVAIAGIATLYGVWWAFVPAAMIIGLLRYVSGVAILEDRLARTRQGFEAYRKHVPALVPRWRNLSLSRQKIAD